MSNVVNEPSMTIEEADTWANEVWGAGLVFQALLISDTRIEAVPIYDLAEDGLPVRSTNKVHLRFLTVETPKSSAGFTLTVTEYRAPIPPLPQGLAAPEEPV